MFTALEPGTGHVLAMSVNRRFGYDVNDPAQESVNLNLVASQGAGSTYKVFVAASALEQGVPAWNRITTSDPYTSRVYKNGFEPYTVQNAGRYPATLTMVQALVMSSNTYFVALEDQLGSVEGPVRMAQRMGLFSLDPVADQVVAENRGSFTLGAEATSPLALASAYSTLGANGTQCDPTPVTEILHLGEPLTDADGAVIDTGNHCTADAVPPAVATTLNQILVGDTASPTGTGTRAAIPGHDIAGKTGTSQNRLLRGVRRLHPAVRGQRDGAQPEAEPGHRARTAAAVPRPIWHDAMLPILSAQEPAFFPPAGLPLNPPRPPPRPDSSDDGSESPPDDAGRPRRRRRTRRAAEPARHQVGGPLAEQHRRRGRSAGGRRRQHRGVDHPQPVDAAHPQLLVHDRTPVVVRTHPRRAAEVHRGGRPAPDPAVECARRRRGRRRAGRCARRRGPRRRGCAAVPPPAGHRSAAAAGPDRPGGSRSAAGAGRPDRPRAGSARPGSRPAGVRPRRRGRRRPPVR